jgi:hypothetical protein
MILPMFFNCRFKVSMNKLELFFNNIFKISMNKVKYGNVQMLWIDIHFLQMKNQNESVNVLSLAHFPSIAQEWIFILPLMGKITLQWTFWKSQW